MLRDSVLGNSTLSTRAAMCCCLTLVLYIGLALIETEVSVFNFARFSVWIVLLVLPLGYVLSSLVRWRLHSEMTSEDIACYLTIGILTLPCVTVLLSTILPNALSLGIALGVLAAGVSLASFRLLRKNRCKTSFDLPLVIPIVAAAAHIILLPSYAPYFDEFGGVNLWGIGEDSFYFPIGQQIARLGGIDENPWYAGTPIFRHHLFSQFLVSSFLLTFGYNADIVQTRLLFHFLLGLPLLLMLVFLVVRKMNVGEWWALALIMCIALPVTSYPFRGGWTGLEGMNGFWIMGVHADMNYLFGLIAFSFVTLAVCQYAAGSFQTVPALVGLQVALALSTQFKANFALAYYPVAQVFLVGVCLMERKFRLAIVSVATSFGCTVLMYALLDHITQGSTTRSIGLEYGSVVMGTFFPILQGNAPDGLETLVRIVEATPGIIKPVVATFSYALAYSPLIAAVPLHAMLVLQRRNGIDVFLILSCGLSVFIALFVVENNQRVKWNVASHLHYLIPIFGMFSAARLVSSNVKAIRQLTSILITILICTTAYGIAKGQRGYNFDRSITTYFEKDLLDLFRSIKMDTPIDTVILQTGFTGWEDRYIMLLADRSLFYSETFDYSSNHPDHKQREAVVECLKRASTASGSFECSQFRIEPMKSRPVVLIGRSDVKEAEVLDGVRRFGNYYYYRRD